MFHFLDRHLKHLCFLSLTRKSLKLVFGFLGAQFPLSTELSAAKIVFFFLKCGNIDKLLERLNCALAVV